MLNTGTNLNRDELLPTGYGPNDMLSMKLLPSDSCAAGSGLVVVVGTDNARRLRNKHRALDVREQLLEILAIDRRVDEAVGDAVSVRQIAATAILQVFAAPASLA